jgi:hypothetical protein
MQHCGKYQSKILMKVINSKFSWLVYDSSYDIMYCDFCRKAGPDI